MKLIQKGNSKLGRNIYMFNIPATIDIISEFSYNSIYLNGG